MATPSWQPLLAWTRIDLFNVCRQCSGPLRLWWVWLQSSPRCRSRQFIHPLVHELHLKIPFLHNLLWCVIFRLDLWCCCKGDSLTVWTGKVQSLQGWLLLVAVGTLLLLTEEHCSEYRCVSFLWHSGGYGYCHAMGTATDDLLSSKEHYKKNHNSLKFDLSC